MQKKICPICNSELKNGRYCRVCRKVIWKPLVQEQNYHLNEQKQPETQQREEIQEREGLQNRHRRHFPFAAGLLLFTLFLCVLGVNHFIRMSRTVVHTIQELEQNGSGQDLNDQDLNEPGADKQRVSDNEDAGYGEAGYEDAGCGDEGYGDSFSAERGTYESRELTASEVKNAGLHCNYYGHSSVGGEQMNLAVLELLRESGFGEIESEPYEYNERVSYQNGSEDTIYNTSFYYDITAFEKNRLNGSKPSSQDFIESVEVGYDTATGETHYVTVYSQDIDFLVNAAIQVTACFDSLDPKEQPDDALIDEGLRGMDGESDEGSDFWITKKNWELYAEPAGTGSRMSIGAVYQY